MRMHIQIVVERTPLEVKKHRSLKVLRYTYDGDFSARVARDLLDKLAVGQSALISVSKDRMPAFIITAKSPDHVVLVSPKEFQDRRPTFFVSQVKPVRVSVHKKAVALCLLKKMGRSDGGESLVTLGERGTVVHEANNIINGVSHDIREYLLR